MQEASVREASSTVRACVLCSKFNSAAILTTSYPGDELYFQHHGAITGQNCMQKVDMIGSLCTFFLQGTVSLCLAAGVVWLFSGKFL